MKRSNLKELHCITPIENLPSIFELGILSFNEVKKLKHKSIAMGEIQDRRENKELPNGKRLHDYANLYFHGRNPMMSKRREGHKEICVLRINPGILDVPSVIVADRNASSDYARFESAPEGLEIVDESLVFSMDWRDQNQIEYFKKKSAKCAEVLVPGKVPSVWIMGAYVSCQEALEKVEKLDLKIITTINPELFFFGG